MRLIFLKCAPTGKLQSFILVNRLIRAIQALAREHSRVLEFLLIITPR